MRQPSNALLCPSKLTMKSAIILQHKYFIPYLDADLRRHHRNTNEPFSPMEMRGALCEYDLAEWKFECVRACVCVRVSMC